MPRYIAFDAESELNGITALAFIKSIQHEDIAAILNKHEMENIDPASWYPLQNVLNVLSDIYESNNATTNFVSIGMASSQIAVEMLPPELTHVSLEHWLLHYPPIYQRPHRGGDVGEVEVEKQTDDHYIITWCVHYPDDLLYGIMYGYVRYFCPPDKRFSLRYDPDVPRREEGGERTIVHVYLT